MKTSLPENWYDIKYHDKILFVNPKDNLICYHPPMELSKISIFFYFYQVKSTKEEFENALKNTLSTSTQGKELIAQVDSQMNCTNEDSSMTSQQEGSGFDTNPITDLKKLKAIKSVLSSESNISNVLRQVVFEKYSTLPNYEYETENENNKLMYKCKINIRGENQLSFGYSEISKLKAREAAIKEGLKKLIPGLYLPRSTEMKKSEENTSKGSCPCEPYNTLNVFTNANISDSIFICDKKRMNEIIDLNSNTQPDSDFDVQKVISKRGNLISDTPKCLAQKRKMESYNSAKAEESKKKKVRIESGVEKEDVIFSSCIVDNGYDSLFIDDPLIVEKYINCSNFTPISILQTFKSHNPHLDVKEKSYTRNDSIKFENLENNSYSKYVIESEKLGIRVEGAADNKKKARDYSAQKFLRKLYQDKKIFKWVDLVKYYEERRYVND